MFDHNAAISQGAQWEQSYAELEHSFLDFERQSTRFDSEKKLRELHRKLCDVRRSRGVVCTTPEAVKSLMLK